jgi:hypothetical protein
MLVTIMMYLYNFIKLPETQKQDNSIDCGLFSLANAVEFCQSGFKGGTHIKFEQKYMREHLVHCLEKGNFSAFPKNHVGFAPKNIKINTYKIEIDCECGKPNAIENMIACEGIKGKKNFAMCFLFFFKFFSFPFINQYPSSCNFISDFSLLRFD